MRCSSRVRSVGGFCVLVAMLMTAGVTSAAEPAPAVSGPPAVEGTSPLPLLTWDLLRRTVYQPPLLVLWPEELPAFDGVPVRLEGYIMPRFNYQEPGDLLLSALHPRSIFCGPTDMTALVEVTYPEFTPEDWPQLPVEITGTFHLSKSPRNLFYLYHLRVDSMRVLRRWEQDFPGAVDELRQAQDAGR